jgi:hypothetical protein
MAHDPGGSGYAYGGVSFPSISDRVRAAQKKQPLPPAAPRYQQAPARNYAAAPARYVAPPQPVVRYSVSDRVRAAQAAQQKRPVYTVQRPTYAQPAPIRYVQLPQYQQGPQRPTYAQQPVFQAPTPPPPPPPRVQAPTYQGNVQQYQPASMSAMRQVNAPEMVAYGSNTAKVLNAQRGAPILERSVRRPTPPGALPLITQQGTRAEPLPQLVPSVKYAANVGPLAANMRALANVASPVVEGAARSLWQQFQADQARPDTRPDALRTALTPVSRAVGGVVGRFLGGTAGLGAQVGLAPPPPGVTNLNPVAPRFAPGSSEDIANFWQQRGALGGTLQLSQRPYQIVGEPLLGAAWERQVRLEQAQAQGYNNLLEARRGQSGGEALAKTKEILGAYRGPTMEVDIARYRLEAPPVTQFLMGLAFDPLTYTDALTSLPGDALRAFKAGSKVIDLPLGIHLAGNLAPSMGTVNGVRRVLTIEEVAAETPIAAAKVRSLGGRLNPFQPTPLSMVNALAKESSDMTTRLMEATVAQADNFGGDQFGLFKAALANPDAPEVVRATAGLSQSRPFKRTIMVARRTLGSWDDAGVAAYVAKTGKAEAVAVDLAARAAKQAAIARAALAGDKTGLAKRTAYTAEQLKRLEDVRLAAQTTAEQAAAEVAKIEAAGVDATKVATARKVADDAALVAVDVAQQAAAQQARYATPMSKTVDLTFQKAEAMAADAEKARAAVVARQATTPTVGSFDTANIFKLIERATDPVSGEVDDIAAVADLARQYEDATTSFFATKKVNKAGQEVWDYGATDVTKGAKWVKDNVNNVLSTVYMGYNPGYAWRNAANNLITALADGVTPFQSSDNIRQLWTRWGLPPIATKQGIGAAGDVWKSRESAAEFTRELMLPYRLRDAFKSGVTLNRPTLKMGQAFESYASERIMAHHLRNFWQQTWPRTVRKLSDANLDTFRALGLTPEQINLRVKLASLAMNPDELREALIYGTLPGMKRTLPPSAGAVPTVRPPVAPIAGGPPMPPSVRVPPVVKPGAVERAVITDAAQLLPDAVIEDARKLAGDEFAEAIQHAAATPNATPVQRAALVKIEFAKVDTATATRDAGEAVDALERATNPQDMRSAEDLLGFLGEVDRITAAHIDANDAILDDLWQTTKGLTPQQRKGAWDAYWTTFKQQLDGFHVQLKTLDEEVMPELGFTRKAIERQEARRVVTRQTWDAYTKKLKATWADSDKFDALDPARDAVWAEFKTWRKDLWATFNANQAERMTLRQNDIDVAYLNLRKRGGGTAGTAPAAPPPKSLVPAAVKPGGPPTLPTGSTVSPGAPKIPPGGKAPVTGADLGQVLPQELAEQAQNLAPGLRKTAEDITKAKATVPEKQAAQRVIAGMVDEAEQLQQAIGKVNVLVDAPPPAQIADVSAWFTELRRIESAYFEAHIAAVQATVKAADQLPPNLKSLVWDSYWASFKVKLTQFHTAIDAADETVGLTVGLTPSAAAKGVAFRQKDREFLTTYIRDLAKQWKQARAASPKQQRVLWDAFFAKTTGNFAERSVRVIVYNEQRATDVYEALINVARKNAQAVEAELIAAARQRYGGGGGGAAVAAAPPPKSPAPAAAVQSTSAVPVELQRLGIDQHQWDTWTTKEQQEVLASVNSQRGAVPARGAAVQAAPAPTALKMPNGMDPADWVRLTPAEQQEIVTLLNAQRIALQVGTSEQTVNGFVSRMLRREDLTADADVQFYANNAPAIEAELARVLSPQGRGTNGNAVQGISGRGERAEVDATRAGGRAGSTPSSGAVGAEMEGRVGREAGATQSELAGSNVAAPTGSRIVWDARPLTDAERADHVAERAAYLAKRDKIWADPQAHIRTLERKTGLKIHYVGNSRSPDELYLFLDPFESNWKQWIPSDVKHVVIGHGWGLDDNWRFVGSTQQVVPYVNANVPAGEKAFLMVCDTNAARSIQKASIFTVGATPDATAAAIRNAEPSRMLVLTDNVTGQKSIGRIQWLDETPVAPQVAEQAPVKAAVAQVAPPPAAAPPAAPRVIDAATIRSAAKDAGLEVNFLTKNGTVADLDAHVVNFAKQYAGVRPEVQRIADLTPPENARVLLALEQRASGALPKTPKAAKQAVAAAIEEVKPTVPALAWLDTNEVLLDPTRFQFKLDIKSKGGATGSLADVTTWDDNLGAGVGVWREPATGKIWVVDGHNRVAKAQQLGIKRLKAPVFFEVPTAEEARLVGALRNIANGKGTPIDAAKLFREGGFTPELLAARGLSLRESQVSKGMALANLNDTLFAAVIRKELPIERAVIIGERVPDHDLQMKLVQELDKRLQRGKTVTDPMVAELADMLTTGPQATVVQDTLFGAEEMMQSFALEKADFYAYVRENLAKEKRLFSGAAKNADDLARVATIDKAAAAEISDVARQNIDLFDTFKNQVGAISQLGDEAAEALAKGGNANAIKSAYYQRVIDALPDAARNAFAPTSGDVASAVGSAVVRGAAGEAAEPSLFGLADDAAAEVVTPPLDFTTKPPPGSSDLGIVAPGMAGPAGPPPTSAADTFASVRAALNQPARPIPPATPAQMAALKDLALNKYIPAMTRDKAMVGNLATTMRNFALGDYAHKRNIHEWLSYLYPYSYWYTFTYWNWMQRLLQHPAYLSNYARYRALLHEANVARYREEMGDPNATLPPDWEGTIEVPFAGRLNPERTLMPLNALVESMRSKVKEAVPAIGPFPSGKIMETLTDWGPNIWSPIIYAYGALLEQAGYGEAAEEWVGNLLPQTQPFKSATALWKDKGLPGAAKIPAGGVNIEAFRRPDGTIWEQRRIPKFLADLVDKGLITQEEAALAAYKRAGDAWEQAQQAEAVARAPGNLSSFLIGQGFKPRSAADILINEAYNAKAALNAKQGSLTEEQFFDELAKFNAQYPWYKTYFIGREYDPTARLVAYAKLVFERLPIGKGFTKGLEAAGLTSEQYNRFKADAKAHGWNPATGKDDAENTFANWTPAELAAFTAAVEKMGDTLKVFTPAEKAEIEAGRDAHAAAQLAAVDDQSVRSALTDLGVAGATPYGAQVGLARLKDLEQAYNAIPETEKNTERDAFLAQNPELPNWWNTAKDLQHGTAAAPFYLGPKDDFYYYLPPGYNWQTAAKPPKDIKALLDKAYGGTATDAEYTVVADWLKLNLPKGWTDRAEYATAEKLDKQFDAEALKLFGPDILNWNKARGELFGDKVAQKAWDRAHAKEYAALKKFWDFKTAYGKEYAIWGKYYGFADSRGGRSGSGWINYPRRGWINYPRRKWINYPKRKWINYPRRKWINYAKKKYYSKRYYRKYYKRSSGWINYPRRGWINYARGGGGYSSGGGSSGGGSSGGGTGTFVSPPAPVTTAPPWQAMTLTGFNTALAELRTKNPQLDAVIGKLFGGDVLSDLLAYLALSDADRKLWLADPNNRDLIAALTKFFAWFAELNAKGSGQDTRILGSIPGATPTPPGWPKFTLPTTPMPPVPPAGVGVNNPM